LLSAAGTAILLTAMAVAFGLTERYPEASLRHYTFLVEGLLDAREDLRRIDSLGEG
jgi:hypothetical protein